VIIPTHTDTRTTAIPKLSRASLGCAFAAQPGGLAVSDL
jgi:hypothetical protein